jgi:2,3-bisphosphoglycerate-independent phosphoglycerate mutase
MAIHTDFRVLFLIADGMGDRPIAELGGKTPLEAALTPHLDRLAREGECGLMDPVAPGIRVGSDTGHLALLGYDPYQTYTGRGPFEALGIGMEVLGGDIALRCNFSTVDNNGIVIDRRAGRISEGTTELAAAMESIEVEGVQCFFKESVAHRGALVLRGANLSPNITDADPHEEGLPVAESKPKDITEAAAIHTARIVNAFVKLSHERLKDHPVNQERVQHGMKPANILLPRGAGVAPHITPFNQQHHVNAAAVVETGLIRGIARFLGMETYHAPGTTGGTDSDLMSMAKAIVEALQKHNFVLCNVKGPDLCGHDNQPRRKVDCLERMDAMVGHIVEQSGSHLYILLTADHSTPCSVGDHSGDPVPVVLWGPDLRGDDTTAFHERACAKGSLGRICGRDIVPILTQLMGVQEKFGA